MAMISTQILESGHKRWTRSGSVVSDLIVLIMIVVAVIGAAAGKILVTALCGLARGFWQLFAARIGVGVGEAALSPAAYSLISDSFAPSRLGRALARLSERLGLFGQRREGPRWPYWI